MIPGVDKLLFADFIRAAACRAGQMLNNHDIAQDVGVSDDTARRWLQVLEKSEVIFYLRPYSNNLLKRTVKTPKMYFFDTGLVAYLTRYSSPEILMNGAVKPHTTKVACFRGFSPRISFPPYSENSAFGSLRSQSRIQANKRG